MRIVFFHQPAYDAPTAADASQRFALATAATVPAGPPSGIATQQILPSLLVFVEDDADSRQRAATDSEVHCTTNAIPTSRIMGRSLSSSQRQHAALRGTPNCSMR
mmetsp:Transcript_1468/g.3175  ORF Transcript_1468/g.3175 Transcript_1468/m.3175 type:complete len:105 (-) Transcript_1468:786-1100(-)